VYAIVTADMTGIVAATGNPVAKNKG